MAGLQKQTVTLNLGRSGIDTKTDPTSVLPGKLLACENAVFTNPGRLQTRNGYSATSRYIANRKILLGTDLSPRNLPAGRALATFRDELLAMDGETLYSLSDAGWMRKGLLPSVHVSQASVAHDMESDAFVDGATHSSGLQCYVYETDAGARYRVIDGDGQLLTDGLLDADGVKPKALVLKERFALLWYNTSDEKLYLATVSSGSPLVEPSGTAITNASTDDSSMNTTAPNYDACIVSTAAGPMLCVAFNNAIPAGGVTIRLYPPALDAADYWRSEPGAGRALCVFADPVVKGPVLAWIDGTTMWAAAYTGKLLSYPMVGVSYPSPVAAWEPSTLYGVGNIVENNSRQYICTTGGQTAASGGPTGAGTGIVDNEAVWDWYSDRAPLWGGASAWTPETGYLENDIATNGGNQYICVTAGDSAATGGPTGTGTGIVDGTAEWDFLCIDLDEPDRMTGVAFPDTSATYRIRLFFSGVQQIAGLGIAEDDRLYQPTLMQQILGNYTQTADCIRYLAIGGKPWTYGGRCFLPVSYWSSEQPTLFVIDTGDPFDILSAAGYPLPLDRDARPGSVVARVLPLNAQTLPADAAHPAGGVMMIPESWRVDDATFRLATMAREGVAGVTTTTTYDHGAVAVTFAHEASDAYSHGEIGGQLHFGGGLLRSYDGGEPVELGFNLYPEPYFSSGAAITLEAGGALAAASYQWALVYEWTDANGIIHRGAPWLSPSVAVTLNYKATLRIPCLWLTDKRSVRCCVYRTAGDGTELHLIGSTANDPTKDYVEFADLASDAEWASGTPLYTTGGVLDNTAVGPVGHVVVHRNRLWAIDSTDPLRLWYSKVTEPGAPVEMSADLSFAVDPASGGVTALASLDDKLVVFKSDRTFFVTGQGPDDSGGQYDLSDAVLVTTDCGCIAPRSVVPVPEGIVFQSRKGIYLLGRDLAVRYIGAEVEAYNADSVTAGVLVPDANQVRLSLSSGIVLVYDYLAGAWSVFTPMPAADMAIHDGTHVWLRADGTVMRETPGEYSDAGEWIRLRARTAWLQFAGFQGLQRIWRALVLGAYASPHNLRVSIAYDFDPNKRQIVTVEPTDPGTYGSGATYGSDAVYGGEFPLYQWRIFPNRQQCQAMQIELSTVETDGPGEGCSLSAITFELGVTPGAWRVPAARSAG